VGGAAKLVVHVVILERSLFSSLYFVRG